MTLVTVVAHFAAHFHYIEARLAITNTASRHARWVINGIAFFGFFTPIPSYHWPINTDIATMNRSPITRLPPISGQLNTADQIFARINDGFDFSSPLFLIADTPSRRISASGCWPS